MQHWWLFRQLSSKVCCRKPLPLLYLAVPTGLHSDLAEFLAATAEFYELKPLQKPMGKFLYYSCTCPCYQERLCCKHALAMTYLSGHFTWPTSKTVAKLGTFENKKRGRPTV